MHNQLGFRTGTLRVCLSAHYLSSSGCANHFGVATCRMGVEDDITAVVDSRARVIGVRGLRVIDASSMALLPPVFHAIFNLRCTLLVLIHIGSPHEYNIRHGREIEY